MKTNEASVPRFTRSHKGLRERPPEKSITPIAKSIEKDAMPRSGLGKPKTSPCQEVAEPLHDTNGLKLHGTCAAGSLMSSIVESMRKNDASNPINDPIISK